MINVRTLKRKPTKTSGITRQKTFENQSFIDLDKDISEMDVNIKRYETIKKKNSFLGDKSPIKKEVKIKNKIYRINTYNIKNNDCNSITTSSSNNDKSVKKVTFSTVEIIRVEKYKKYNALNNYSKIDIEKNMEEVKNNSNDDESTCLIF